MDSLNKTMRDDEEKLFKREPRINVISKETYEERVQKVFHLLWKTLAKSFGPYGAPTLIYNFPYSHVTKDGFTIMKNLSMDSTDQLVDQAIANMASDICGRLNYTVGDGTTSAVIATNSIYQNYIKEKEKFDNMLFLPRDIMSAFNNVKSAVVEGLHNHVRSIQTDDPKELYKNIYKVVYISSNGDSVISDYIASLYAELQFPGISCELAIDGITKKRLITGYKYDLSLNDKLYITNDDNTATINGADVIILSVKVTKAVYQNILSPLNEQSRLRKRKLIVCASSYDETALGQVIRRDLLNEYQRTKDINMVLCTYKAISDYTRKQAQDFAMLCNTLIIDRELKASIEKQLNDGLKIQQIFNIDQRDDIPNLICYGTGEDGWRPYINNKKPDGIEPMKISDDSIRLGYIGSATLGLKNSLFTDFYYNEERYNATLRDAKVELEEAEAKYKKLGTFNLVVSQAQQRLYSLRLKMGVIEVGADSELSQKLLKDAVDDAIRAAASAYDNGIVLGCNVHLIKTIQEVIQNYMISCQNNSALDRTNMVLNLNVMEILRNGFSDVYKTVLENAFPDVTLATAEEVSNLSVSDLMKNIQENIIKLFHTDIFLEKEYSGEGTLTDICYNVSSNDSNHEIKLYDLIVEYSVMNECVFDVSCKYFTRDVINSTQTDEEILIATIDLISLLITGNQMLITQKHEF